MLTLKDIIKSARMMEQTGGEYKGFHEDHVPEYNPENVSREPLSPRDEAIVVRLGYRFLPSGDMTIVQE